MKLRLLALPVVVVGMLQVSGCTSQQAATPAPPGGIYVSTSAGAHFDQINADLQKPGEETSLDLATLPLQHAHRPSFNPAQVYVTAGYAGYIISTDGGLTWQQVSVPLASTSDIVALENGTIIVAGTDAQGQGYVLRTVDQGRSWQTVLTIPVPLKTSGVNLLGSNNDTGPATVIISIEPDPHVADRIYAGTSLGNILVGEQSAKTWRKAHTLTSGLSFYGEDQAQVAIDKIFPSPHTPGQILVITATKKLYRLNLEGEQQELVVKGPAASDDPFFGGASAKQVLDVSFIPQFPDALLVGVTDGALYTRDSGSTWHQLPLPVDATLEFNTVATAVSPTNPTRLLVGINEVVYRSEDSGSTWNTFSLQLPNHFISDLLIDPANPANVIAVTRLTRQ